MTDETQDQQDTTQEAEVITHAEMVTKLAKPGEDIKSQMTLKNWPVLTNALGNAVLAGNIVDNAKKQTIYNKDRGLSSSPARSMPDLSAEQYHLIHMVIGVFGEAAELVEAVRNNVVFGKPLDLTNIVEELGDIEFYLEGLRQGTGITREESLEGNLLKLLTGEKPRYGAAGYSDAAAQERADKQEPVNTEETVIEETE
jgi:NTP pyrophosphatase (non-canonical NTP hydrolase)